MKNDHTFVVLAYKESEYLEKCIKSVVNQSKKTNVVIATSTPNDFINGLSKKYNLNVIINKETKGLANDFNFAINCVDSDLVTIAHQDDVYDKEYTYEIMNQYNKYKDSIIFYTDYYEIRNKNKVYNNTNLKIKKILLLFTKSRFLSKYKFFKRSAIRFGNGICCPSVTFCKKNITEKDFFDSHFTCDMDWSTWEKFSKMKGRFIYINKTLMGHRVHEESTTTEIINSGVRTKEDYEMFLKFWPKAIAKLINRFYKNSEKSNKV